MKFILGDRGSGVTTDIVLEATKYGGVIICSSFAQANYVAGMSERMGVENISALSIQDVIKNDALSHYPDAKIFVSDVKYVLWELLKEHGATGNIETVSSSLYMSERMCER